MGQAHSRPAGAGRLNQCKSVKLVLSPSKYPWRKARKFNFGASHVIPTGYVPRNVILKDTFLWNVVFNDQLGTFCNIGGIAAEELCIICVSIAIAGQLKLQAELAVPGQVDESTGL